MSKKITMEYNEYLEWQDKLKKYEELIQAFKDKGKCLYIYKYSGIYNDFTHIIDMPSVTKEVLKNMTVKEFKEWKKMS